VAAETENLTKKEFLVGEDYIDKDLLEGQKLLNCVWVSEECLKAFVGGLEGDCGIWTTVSMENCVKKVFCGVKSLEGGEKVENGKVRLGKG
jgi:S-adenosylmethionine synthetase